MVTDIKVVGEGGVLSHICPPTDWVREVEITLPNGTKIVLTIENNGETVKLQHTPAKKWGV